jgi:solute:Na+ symporter, SSS family
MIEDMLLAQTGTISGQFKAVDWAVVVGYLVLTTVIGKMMAGKQATIRDFFLGGRKLPWYAVCGSNIATEISAVTFVGVPGAVFAAQGNFTYLQLQLIGLLLARIIVGYVFVPAYYEREIYSPYDYMANRLGSEARTVTTCLFVLGGSLAQGARVYLAALILDLIIGRSIFSNLSHATGISTLTWSICTFGAIAVTWCWIGGITTVIWTDVILFLVFLTGAFVALGAAVAHLPGGWSELLNVGWNAKQAGPWGKFTVFDLDPSLTKPFTLWTGLIAYTWFGVGVFGTDQTMAQRVFCCKGPRPARWAVIGSNIGQIVTITIMFVGVGLYAFYQRYPLTGEALNLVTEKRDRILPIFIIQHMPPGITGLVIAGIFAAAISGLVSVVASFSQTTLVAFYLPWYRWHKARKGIIISTEQAMQNPRLVLLSRVLVLVWGVMLCLTARLAEAANDKFPQILDLALSMAGYTGGALLAGFMLAFLKLKIDARGFIFSAPLSVLTVFALVWHQSWGHQVCGVGTVALLGAWFVHLYMSTGNGPAGRPSRRPVLPLPQQTVLLLIGVATMLAISYFGYFDTKVAADTGKVTYITLAWPWFIPIGSLVAFFFGLLLARRNDAAEATA